MVQQNAQIRPNSADETIQVGVIQIRFPVTGAESNGNAAIFELTIPAGARLPAPAHSHDPYEETLYGLSGITPWTIDGVPIEVRPGQALCIPRGAVHAFANHEAVDAKALSVLNPAVIGTEFFREVGVVIEAAEGPPPDWAKMVEIMRRHGLTPVKPPSAKEECS
jgi:quercetin dioxygenase-like cupin family protein